MRAVCHATTITMEIIQIVLTSLCSREWAHSTMHASDQPARWLQDPIGKSRHSAKCFATAGTYVFFAAFHVRAFFEDFALGRTAAKQPRSHAWKWLFGTRWLNPIKPNQSVFNPVSKSRSSLPEQAGLRRNTIACRLMTRMDYVATF